MSRMGSVSVVVAFVLSGVVGAWGADKKITAEQAKKAVQAMEQSHLTLAMAISAAERDSKGQAIGGYAQTSRELTIVVPVLVEDKVMQAVVNNTGEVAETKDGDKKRWDPEQARETAQAFRAAAFTWSTLVDTAERHTKGKAVRADAKVVDGKIAVYVTCLAGDELKHCKIDHTGAASDAEDKPRVSP